MSHQPTRPWRIGPAHFANLRDASATPFRQGCALWWEPCARQAACRRLRALLVSAPIAAESDGCPGRQTVRLRGQLPPLLRARLTKAYAKGVNLRVARATWQLGSRPERWIVIRLRLRMAGFRPTAVVRDCPLSGIATSPGPQMPARGRPLLRNRIDAKLADAVPAKRVPDSHVDQCSNG